MTYIVTGARGFLGHHIVKALLARGDTVVGIDNLSAPGGYHNPDPIHENYTPARMDATTAGVAKGVDTIIHCAASQDYTENYDEYYYQNIFVPAHIISNVNQLGISPYILLASSQAAENPCSAYGVSKRAMEMMAIQAMDDTGLKIGLARFSIILGPNKSPCNAYSGALRNFATAFLCGDEPRIYGSGLQIRDFVHYQDAVEAVLKMIAQRANSIHNIGGGVGYEVRWLAREVALAFGFKNYHPRPCGLTRQQDPDKLIQNIGHTNRALGWKPERCIKDAIHEYVRWLRDTFTADQLKNLINRTEEEMVSSGVLYKS